jgi:adenylate cyclase
MDALINAGTLAFAGFRFDVGLRRLSRQDAKGVWAPVAAGKRALDVLGVLLEQPGMLVQKNAIMEQVWPGIAVEANNLPVQITALRRVLDIGRASESCIQTVAGRGYRFVAPITRLVMENSSEPLYPSAQRSKPPRLSMLVAPFRNLGMSVELEHLVEGITEDFTTDLLQLPGSVVVDGAEALRRIGRVLTSPGDLARELGLAYVINGSISGTTERVGINVRVICVQSEAHIWGERFNVEFDGAADARNEITGRLVRSISIKLIDDVSRRIEAVPLPDWTTYDFVMRGRAFVCRAASEQNRDKAIRCFEQALDRDHDSIDAKLGIAFILIINVGDCYSNSAERDLERAEQLLLDVLQTDDDIVVAHICMGLLRRHQGRLDESQIEFEKALEIAPAIPYAICQLGLALTLLGDPEGGISQIEKSLRLAPHDPGTPVAYLYLGRGHLLLDHIKEAVIYLKKARAGNPRLFYNHLYLAAALARMGEAREAASALQQAIEMKPEIGSISALRALPQHSNPKFLAFFDRTICAGLRCAGMPD